MDERRIQKTGELLVEYSNIETKVMPIIQKCLDNIKAMESLSTHHRYCVKVIGGSYDFQLPFASVCPLSKNKTTCKTLDDLC